MINLKKIIIGTVASIAIAAGIWYALPSQANGCNDPYGANIVRCGTWNRAGLKAAYSDPQTRNIYTTFGISADMINNGTLHEGVAHASNNTITVNGRTVVTGAKTIQMRHVNTASPERYYSITGGNYPVYPLSNSFVPKGTSMPAFVWLDGNGRFIAAVVKDCGNPIWGTIVEPPKPVLTCDLLQAQKLAAENAFRLTVKATYKNGASVTNYTYDLGDGNKRTTASPVIDYTYAKPGTYKATVTVNGDAGGAVSKTSASCQTTVTIAEKPQPKTPAIDITKTVNQKKHDVIELDQPFTYEITVANTGEVDLKDVKVSDVAPSNISLTKVEPTAGTLKDNTWNHTIPSLKVGEKQTFVITAVAKSYAAEKLVNNVCVNAPEVNPDKPNENDDCDEATVEMKAEACNTQTGVIEKVKPGTENTAPYTTDLSKCGKVRRCDVTVKRIVEVTRNEADSNPERYVAEDSEKCQPVPATPTTPTPSELPKTGANVLVGGIGLGAFVAATSAYVASRRKF